MLSIYFYFYFFLKKKSKSTIIKLAQILANNHCKENMNHANVGLWDATRLYFSLITFPSVYEAVEGNLRKK